MITRLTEQLVGFTSELRAPQSRYTRGNRSRPIAQMQIYGFLLLRTLRSNRLRPRI